MEGKAKLNIPILTTVTAFFALPSARSIAIRIVRVTARQPLSFKTDAGA
jgi:hypothetical protein